MTHVASLFKRITDAILSRWWLELLVILGLFFAMWWVLAYPQSLYIGSRLLGGTNDALQNVWNLWHVNRALEIGLPLWFTTALYSPTGVTLHGHALGLLNGLIGYGLQQLSLSLVGTYNFLVIFSFVGTGFGMYYLGKSLTHSRWAGIVGGIVVSFSAFHWGHAANHLEMMSIQWLVFYVFFLVRLMQYWTWFSGIGTVLMLYACLVLSPYIFLSALIISLCYLPYSLWLNRHKLTLPRYRWMILGLVVLVLAIVGSRIWWLQHHLQAEQWFGIHNPTDFSMDLLWLMIPTKQLWLGSYVTPYFVMNFGLTGETGVYLGWASILLAVYGVIPSFFRRDYRFVPWLLCVVVGLIVAVGPVVRFMGHQLASDFVGYRILLTIFPSFEMAGVPLRLFPVVLVGLGSLVSYGTAKMLEDKQGNYALMVLLMLLLLERIPAQLPTTPTEIDGCYEVLKAHYQQEGGLLDDSHTFTYVMYRQTYHGVPLVNGYISRTPSWLIDKSNVIRAMYESGDYKGLKERGVAYLISNRRDVVAQESLCRFKEGDLVVYRL